MLRQAIFLFVLFVVGAVGIARAQRVEAVPIRQPFSAFPQRLDEWRGRDDARLTEKELTILGADDYLLRSYFASTTAASVYIGYWSSQKRGDTVHSPLNCLPGSGWQPSSKRPLIVPVHDSRGNAADIQVNRIVIQKGLDKQLVLYWYQSHGRVIDSEYWGKFYLVADAVRLGRSDTAIVRVITPIPRDTVDSEATAERTATEFVQKLFPTLDGFIPS